MTNHASSDGDFCLQKLDSAISLAERLRVGDYPHRDSERGIDRIIEVYKAERAELVNLKDGAQPDTILECCRGVNIKLVRLKIFLGMLLRSANLRNAFEQYFPIKILAAELLGKGASLVFSSEWNFSPFTYPMPLPELPEFVFIGIPASECQNPLIMPLAGHELGHVVWRRKKVREQFDPKIKDAVVRLYKENWSDFIRVFGDKYDKDRIEIDLFMRRIWLESYTLCQRQIEEIFCDFVGFYVFGPSFCYSFRYLLAPSLGFKRSQFYPRIIERAEYLVYLANMYEVKGFESYPEAFSEEEADVSPDRQFILKIADLATKELYKELQPFVEEYCKQAEKFDAGAAEESGIEACFRNLVPAASVRSMAAVVNAAWKLRLNIETWEILDNITDMEQRRKEKLRILDDLVLKSFEVFEYRKRLAKNATEL